MQYYHNLLEAYDEVREGLGDKAMCFMSGSTLINGKGKDLDIVVLPIDQTEDEFSELLYDLGFECNIDREGYEDAINWSSWRKGRINVIVTWKEEEYKAWQLATDICCELASLNKGEIDKPVRVLIHKALRENKCNADTRRHAEARR